jgi:hypothetical protein
VQAIEANKARAVAASQYKMNHTKHSQHSTWTAESATWFCGIAQERPIAFAATGYFYFVSAIAWSINWYSFVRSTTSTNGAPLLLAVTTQIVGVCSIPIRCPSA